MKSNLLFSAGVVAICLTAFVTIAILVDQIFEHVPHSEDEVAYVFQAKVFAQNKLSVPTPDHDDAFWSPFVVDHAGQRFSNKYPIGWSLLLSFGYRLNRPWLINALLGTATLALIAWLGTCFYCADKKEKLCSVAILAAGLGLVTPGFLFLSSSLLSHSASLILATLALVALYYLTISGETRFNIRGHHLSRQLIYALLVGWCLGALFTIRTFAAFGIGAAVGIFLLDLIRRREARWTVLIWLTLGGLPMVGVLMLYWQAVAGDPLFNPYQLVWPYDQIGFGSDVGPYGYGLYEAIFINTRLKLTTLASGLYGWPGWSNLFFLVIPFLTRYVNRWDWLLLGTIAGLVVVYIFYWSFGGVDGGFPRYYYDALPAFLLLTARGIQISGRLLGRYLMPQLRWVPFAVVIGFIGYSLTWTMPPLLEAQKGKYNITPAPLQVVEQANLTEPALVMVKDVESWSDFAAPFAANSPTLDGRVVYAIDWMPSLTFQVRRQFSERACWELRGDSLSPCPLLNE